MAAVADAYAYCARERADAAQRALSEIKIFIALLPDGTAFELKAPRPNAEAPPTCSVCGPACPSRNPIGSFLHAPPRLPPPLQAPQCGQPTGDDADNYFGAWSRARMKAMDRRFAAAMARAEAVGSSVQNTNIEPKQWLAGRRKNPREREFEAPRERIWQ